MKKKTIGIIQPGKLGDLIICLPIAKYYHDQGFEVHWPVFNNFAPMMTEVVDYVKYIPVSNDVYKCVPEAYEYFKKKKPTTLFDIAATFPGSKCTEEYVALGDGYGEEKFDQFKYRKCNVPFELKWKLEYKRDLRSEQKVYDDMIKSEKYDVISTKHSRGDINVRFASKYPIIQVNENYNIFHWRKVLENAKCIGLVDSAMANLVEQLNLPNKKVLLRKPGHPTPTFRNEWRIQEVQ